MLLALTRAPSMIMLATLMEPSDSASSLVGTATISMSVRADSVCTSDELAQRRPPDCRVLWNLTKEGWFMAMTTSGDEATGEAISSSETATVQLAVPPRTSTP